MNPVENLHYAIGQLAFAVAFSDGKVQREERERFQNIVVSELKGKEYGFNVSDIVFQKYYIFLIFFHVLGSIST